MAQGTTSFGALSTNVNVSVSGTNNAAFVSQSGVPGVMVPGQVYPVSITLQNTGTNTWRTVYGYKLASNNPWDNTNWGFNRVALPNDVAPGEQVTFSFNATAPTTPGTYNFQWQMLREGVAAFGAASPNVAVSVNGANDSSFLSQSVPEVMGTAQSSSVSVTLRNTGTTTWAPGSYFLGSENPEANTTWGTNRAELASPVAPGAIVTVEFNITSPAAVGTYDFRWRMVQNSARFGAFTENASVTVSDADGAAFVSQSVPVVMAPGQAYPVSVTLRNTGGTTWAPGSYFLGSENPQANSTWGTNRVDLAVPVGPGAYVTLAFNVTAPSAVGVYNFQWRMVNNSTRFGAFTTNYPVDVVQGQAQTLYFVHADHLNTPRLVADATGTTVWRWDQAEPFGNNPADEDPDANSVAFDLPLRLPGQQYDKETALHYNLRRDYDPVLGRYGQSDPMGLKAGLNTYAYVSGAPVRWTDPMGLFCTKDFVDHYYFGSGETVDLGAVGLLANFQRASSVRNSVNSFKNKARSAAAGEARKLCTGTCPPDVASTSFSLNDRDVTDVTNEPCLFAVGNSTFFRSASCGVSADCKTNIFLFGCSLSFGIRDWFRDPIGQGTEIGGIPYRINANWTDSVSGEGKF
jgi:RHS repeat-associated protein